MPPPKQKRTRIKQGSVSLPFYEWTDPRTGKTYWRWSWKDTDGKWKYGTRAGEEEAKEAARARARTIAQGSLDLDMLTQSQIGLIRQFIKLDPSQADVDKLVEWRKSRKTTVTSVLDDWYAAKIAELHGKESANLRKTHQWLAKFARFFGDRSAAEIREKEIRNYIEDASKSPKSRMDFRMRVVSLWRFARVHEHFDSQEAAKLPGYKPEKKGHISIWSPEEMKILLKTVDAEFLPWLCFAGFSGLRSEEIAPSASTGKPPLRWEWIKRDQGSIDIPANLSKVKKRRLVPITETLAAWLDYINPPKEGVVCPRLPSKYATKALGESVGGWRKNDLRHSYGTYRAAVLKNLPQLALEMGNSVEKIEDHYREAVTEEVAQAYWNLIPSDVIRMKTVTPLK